jgi:hypothetical protein
VIPGGRCQLKRFGFINADDLPDEEGITKKQQEYQSRLKAKVFSFGMFGKKSNQKNQDDPDYRP